jgi:long-subunit acyl-CoA synthetase (AMP-forming)
MAELAQALSRHSETDGRRLAMSDGGQMLSRAELAQRVAGAAAELRNAPETIGLFGANGIEWAVAFLAASVAGKTIVPIPPFFSKDQIAHLVRDAGITGLLVTSPADFGVHGLSLPAQLLSPRRDSAFPSETGDSGLIIYTSGSTGRAKGVRLASGQALWSAKALAEVSGASADDKYLSVLPMPMLLEAICGILVPVLVGGSVHYDGEIAQSVIAGSAVNIAAAFERERPTTSVLVPQLLALYAAQLAASGTRPPESLRFVAVGGAPLPPAHAAAAARLGITFFEGYGLSECSSVVAVNRPGARRPGTVGRALPGLTVEIDNGEIVVEGPSVMDGYLHGGSAAKRWRTGDLGSLDTDGFLTVHGRRDNLIVMPNGRNVSPEWIEAMLAGDPRIGACTLHLAGNPARLAVLLIPSRRGEEWFAAASPQDLMALVGKACEAAPDYAQPKSVFAVPPVEASACRLFTPNGRIRRAEAARLINNKVNISEANQKLEVTL